MENVTKNLGYVADAYGIITALVNNPIAFDAKITYSRKQVDLKEWEGLAKALGRDPGRYPLSPDDRRSADRIDLLLDMLYGCTREASRGSYSSQNHRTVSSSGHRGHYSTPSTQTTLTTAVGNDPDIQ
jgi:hypothetical protein